MNEMWKKWIFVSDTESKTINQLAAFYTDRESQKKEKRKQMKSGKPKDSRSKMNTPSEKKLIVSINFTQFTGENLLNARIFFINIKILNLVSAKWDSSFMNTNLFKSYAIHLYLHKIHPGFVLCFFKAAASRKSHKMINVEEKHKKQARKKPYILYNN